MTPSLLGQAAGESSGIAPDDDWESLLSSLLRDSQNPYALEIFEWIQQSRLITQEQQTAELLDWIMLRDRLQAFQENRGSLSTVITDRNHSLRIATDDEDEDDLPLSDQAALGFFDFIGQVEYHGVRLELTSANGWLCSEWKYNDGRELVLWFRNRWDTMLTAFTSDHQIRKDLRHHPLANTCEGVVRLLIQEGFFSQRHAC